MAVPKNVPTFQLFWIIWLNREANYLRISLAYRSGLNRVYLCSAALCCWSFSLYLQLWLTTNVYEDVTKVSSVKNQNSERRMPRKVTLLPRPLSVEKGKKKKENRELYRCVERATTNSTINQSVSAEAWREHYNCNNCHQREREWRSKSTSRLLLIAFLRLASNFYSVPHGSCIFENLLKPDFPPPDFYHLFNRQVADNNRRPPSFNDNGPLCSEGGERGATRQWRMQENPMENFLLEQKEQSSEKKEHVA